jgi:hypothetical protein
MTGIFDWRWCRRSAQSVSKARLNGAFWRHSRALPGSQIAHVDCSRVPDAFVSVAQRSLSRRGRRIGTFARRTEDEWARAKPYAPFRDPAAENKSFHRASERLIYRGNEYARRGELPTDGQFPARLSPDGSFLAVYGWDGDFHGRSLNDIVAPVGVKGHALTPYSLSGSDCTPFQRPVIEKTIAWSREVSSAEAKYSLSDFVYTNERKERWL